MHPFHRTELLVGRDGWQSLKAARVLVVGLGGVGSYAAEALARSGVGTLGLVDFDDVCVTNLNRQLHAFRRTVGQSKAELMADRARLINPKARIVAHHAFYNQDTSDELLGPGWDWVVDCIDNVTAKLHLLETVHGLGWGVVASMGAGGRLDPSRIRVTDLAHTSVDPLARTVRKELRKRGVEQGITAVWTDEHPNELDQVVQDCFRCICPNGDNGMHSCEDRNLVQGTVSFLPAMFGMAAAGAVVNGILGRTLHSQRRAERRVGG